MTQALGECYYADFIQALNLRFRGPFERLERYLLILPSPNRIAHPIHLHGHDFWMVGQNTGKFDGNMSALNKANPPRRDVATLPGNGYLALAFKLDNPGTWLVHCHIAWHQSEGLSLQIVEDESIILWASVTASEKATEANTCRSWRAFVPTEEFEQDDSGI